jgi:UDP-N-acetyl-D-glucosamine dehydrogenase
MTIFERTLEKFQRREALVGILGLGYAGLPLACTFAEAGFKTVGFDIDAAKIKLLRNGESYVGNVPSERLEKLVTSGRLSATESYEELATCDAAIVCVPTPLDDARNPDLSFVVSTAREVRKFLHPGQLVVLESTTYPGTTEEVVLPILAEAGLEVGEEFFLAFSPEREDPANHDYRTRTIPKLVGGLTDHCREVACAAYDQVVEVVVPVGSTRVAEAAKLLENIYRCVNIAMVNELKLLFDRIGLDVWEVIRAASTKPFGFAPFYPGPGLGGHCIPIDPFYLTWKARQHGFATRFIELAGEINSSMPEYVVDRLSDGLNLQGKPLKDAAILLLGVAYKRDIEDTRESPAVSIMIRLNRRLARVSYHDPHVPHLRTRYLSHTLSSVALTSESVRSSDAVVIVTDHSDVDYEMIVRNAKLVVDTRNATARFRQPGDNVILA